MSESSSLDFGGVSSLIGGPSAAGSAIAKCPRHERFGDSKSSSNHNVKKVSKIMHMPDQYSCLRNLYTAVTKKIHRCMGERDGSCSKMHQYP